MSPRTKTQLIEIRETSRSSLFRSALTLFGNKGYESTSVLDIVQTAGFSKGLFYHYFNSKEDLLRQMIDELSLSEAKMLEDIYSEDPKMLMQNLLSFFFKEMSQNFEQWRLIMSLSVQIGKYDFIHELAMSKMNGYLQLFEELLTRLDWKNPHDEAKLIVATLDGIGIQYMVLKEDYHLKRMEEILKQKYC